MAIERANVLVVYSARAIGTWSETSSSTADV